MSIFGPITDDDDRRWQQRNLQALTKLVELGVKKKLPPLFWTLPGIGAISGKVDGSARRHNPRDAFEAWCAALATYPGVEPRNMGFRGEGPTRSERTNDVGQTRMMAGFTLRLPAGKCDIALIAEWFADELVPAVES